MVYKLSDINLETVLSEKEIAEKLILRAQRYSTDRKKEWVWGYIGNEYNHISDSRMEEIMNFLSLYEWQEKRFFQYDKYLGFVSDGYGRFMRGYRTVYIDREAYDLVLDKLFAEFYF